MRAALSLAVLMAAGPAPAGEGMRADCAPGFTAIPGTRTCLRVGGRVRAEAEAGRGAPRGTSSGTAILDARTATDLGPMRTFLRIEAGPR